MREIKFRFWFKNVKAMMNQEDMHQCCIEGDYDFLEVLTGQDSRITPMQYTGLKDKNGVEIYEGDIVEIWSEHPGGDIGTTGEVKFYECQYWIDNSYGAIELFREDCQTEIKGNIHQNP